MQMYPKKPHKSDYDRFMEAFRKKVGATPEEYLRRKLALGVSENELSRAYDQIAIEIACKLHCTAVRYADLQKPAASGRSAGHMSRSEAPACPRCGARMVRRTAQKGPNAGEVFWGCSGYPECRYKMKLTDGKT